MVNPRNNPKFVRWLSVSLKRVKSPWRKPHGINSKVRAKLKGKLPMPTVGYKAPKKMIYLHPSGFKEILVHNVKELERVGEKDAVRISSTVGKRKKTEIVKKAGEMKLKILNP
ncbi:MAG: 50S ribosomal protein L32e [Candidatus Aenigmarchaeota archaeon]|nr:50S ribosomal protein L32e [Candidatus Aenigmarchaeota archaeon]